TRTTIGVLQEPIQLLFFIPSDPPGSSCFQTCSPVFLLTASRNCRSPGPHHRIARSPCRIGEEALPQTCSSLPRFFFHSSLPAKSEQYMPGEPKLTTTRSPSVAGEAEQNGLVGCVASRSS